MKKYVLSAGKNFQWYYPASSVCQSQVSGKFLRTFVVLVGAYISGNSIELKPPTADGKANATADL